MKRKWWVILAGAVLVVAIWLSLGGRSRIIRNYEPGTSGIVGLAPDGRLALFGTNGLTMINEHGDLEVIPVSGASAWGGWPVASWGTNGIVVYEQIPGGGGSLQALDWAGNEHWSFLTNAPIGLPASDAAGNVCFFGPNWEVLSFAPNGEQRWVYPYQSAAPGFQLRSLSPIVSVDGRVAVLGDRPSGLVMLDSNGTEQWRRAIPGGLTESGGAFAPTGDLLARVGWELWKIDPAGEVLWLFDMAEAVTNRNRSSSGMLAPISGPDGTVYCSVGQWVFAIGSDGVLQWKFRRDASEDGNTSTTMGMGQSWGSLSSAGDLMVIAGDWKSVTTTGAGGAMTIFNLVDNERVVCLNREGEAKWEQSFPSSFAWWVPRNRLDLKMWWKSRMGLRASKHLNRPTITPNGTIYVSGWANGKSRIWAIQDDDKTGSR